MDGELVDEATPLEVAEDSQRQRKEDDEYSPNRESRRFSQEVFIPVKQGQDYSQISPRAYEDILHGKNVVKAISDAATSQHPRRSLFMDDAGVTVEELTVKSYNGSSLDIGTSSNRVHLYNQQKHWQNLYQLANNSGIGNSLSDIGQRNSGQAASSAWQDIGSTSFPELLARKSLSDGQSNVVEHLVDAESKEGEGDVHGGIRTKIISKSGFAEYFIKNTLKGKGTVCRGPSSDGFFVQPREQNQTKAGSDADQNQMKTGIGTEQNLMKTGIGKNKNKMKTGIVTGQKQMKTGFGTQSNSNLSGNYSSKTAKFPSYSDAMPRSGRSERDGVTLREWLKSGHHKASKVESLNIFRKIVDLVDDSHSQGVALHNLCPSYIKLLPSNQVVYLGLPTQKQMVDSVVNSEVLHLDNSFIRKRMSEQVLPSPDMGSKKHKFNDNVIVTGSDLCLETASDHKVHIPRIGSQDYRNEYEEDIQFSKYNIGRMSSIPHVSNAGQLSSTFLSEGLENKWYASPEGGCTTSSNIYCLGVLLFEVCRLVHDASLHYLNAVFLCSFYNIYS